MPDEIKLTKISDLSDGPEGTEIAIDPEFDAYDVPAPPPAGAYALKVYLGRDGWQVGEASDGVFYIAPLEAKVADGPYRGRTVFTRLDTRVWPGKDNHTMGTFLAKAVGPDKLPKTATARRWAQLLDRLLKREPIVYAYLDWQAYSRDEEAVVASGMANFPRKGDGYSHIVKDKRGNLCYARPVVVRWLSKREFDQALTSMVEPRSVVPSPVASDEDDLPF